MSYGHAERNLAVIRLLEAEAEQLLRGPDQPGPTPAVEEDGPGGSRERA